MFDLNDPSKRSPSEDLDYQPDEQTWLSEREIPTQPGLLWRATTDVPSKAGIPESSETGRQQFLSETLPPPSSHLSEYHPREFVYQERTSPPFAFRERRSHAARNILLVTLVLLFLTGGALSTLALSGKWQLPWQVHPTPWPTGTPGVPVTHVPTTVPPATTAYDQWVQTHGVMFGFNAQHSGFNPYESTLNPSNVSRLTQAWLSDAIGENYFSSPVVSGGLVYAGTYAGQLYAIDISTGHVRWTSNAASSSTSSNISTPAVINGMVYICLQDRRLYAFDAQNGQLRWVSPSGDVADSSPIVADGVVYVTGNGSVSAFDAVTGRLRWASAPIGSSYPPVAVANGVVYVSISGQGAGTGRVAALNAASGQTLWVSDLINGRGIDINSAPTVANGLVYIGAGNGGVAAFDAASGHVRWVTPATTGSTGSSPEVANGVVYISEDKIYAFNATTGASLWTSDAIGAYNGDSPVIANGVLYVCTSATNGAYVGSLYALNASTGHTLWASSPTQGQIFTTPAVANGVVYVASGDRDGKIYAFHLPG